MDFCMRCMKEKPANLEVLKNPRFDVYTIIAAISQNAKRVQTNLSIQTFGLRTINVCDDCYLEILTFGTHIKFNKEPEKKADEDENV